MPPTSGVGLLAALGAAAAARGDAVRRARVDALLTHLLEAPPPAGAAVCAALKTESALAGYAEGVELAAAAAFMQSDADQSIRLR